MSTHDPKDGLTDKEHGVLVEFGLLAPALVETIRRLARENAALKAELSTMTSHRDSLQRKWDGIED